MTDSLFRIKLLSPPVAALLFLSLILTMPVTAQQRTGSAARIVVIKPKEGMQKQFEEGYKRHLEWHRQNKDTWVWYGWQVISGGRFGYFIDGTFGHRWENFDAAVNPAGDAADNALNVVPNGDFLSLSHYVQLSDVSSARLLEEATPSVFLELIYYRLNHGREKEFERILQMLHEAQSKANQPRRYTWYRLVSGGEHPMYLLMLPINKLSDFQTSERLFTSLLAEAFPAKQAASLMNMLSATVRNVSSETLRYRVDLSYFPPKQ